MIEVIADEVLIDAEIVAANESRRLGRQILQQSRDLIIGTPFQDVKVIEVLDINRRVCQDDGCRFFSTASCRRLCSQGGHDRDGETKTGQEYLPFFHRNPLPYTG